MKKTAIILSAMMLLGSIANGQSLLKRIGESAKNKVENKIENKADEGVDAILDGKIGKKNKKDKKDKKDLEKAQVESAAVPQAEPQKIETGFAKSDFVPGDEVFFEDPVENEKVGEFPSRWEFLSGEECEIITLNGEQVIKLSG